MWKRHARMMAEATGGDGGSGGGDGAPAATAADPAAATAATTTAPPPEAKPADTAAAPPAKVESALKKGEGADATPPAAIPEKYQVKREDGTIDVEASSLKLAEAYSHLEKRMGSGDMPPKDASEYKITVPESMGEYKPSEDPTMTGFLADAQKVGMTQAQMEVVMDHYFKAAPQLAGAGASFSAEQATAALRDVWKTEGDFNRHTGLAFQATSAAIERAGVSMDDVEKSGLGNNPVFIRLMAGLGAEFQEDKAPNAAAFKSVTKADIGKMEASEAYRDPKHPDHASVTEAVKRFYERTYGNDPA